MRKRLRIFISSPGDVAEERLRANLVVQKLARDYARFFEIEPYLWEHEPMLASGHFQDTVEPPSRADIVVLIVYSRLGTPLPERTTVREYHGIDGRAPVTGTEWEFEEALAAHRAQGAPDLLAYRKVGDPGASLTDAVVRAEQERQWLALEAFWRRHFEGSGIFLAGSARFNTLEEFDQKLEADLTALIERRIAANLHAEGSSDAIWLRGSPFRGLAAYDFEDASIFFGRDAQTRTALTRLQGAAERGAAFLLVLGASGSGKSSLARAGLLPALLGPKAVPGIGLWRRVVLRPGEGGEDPVVALAKALTSGDAASGIGLPELLGSGSNAEALAAHLAAAADDPSYPFRIALDKIADEARKAGKMLDHEQARLVLLVDQMEELYTRRVDPERRNLFVRILAGLARSGLVWCIVTMRNDLWHRAAETPMLVNLVEAGARLDLLRPDGSEIIEIVRRPAAAAGLKFESDSESGVGLDAVIARAAAEEPGVLPLLSVMLESLYERDIAGHAGGPPVLTFASYRALGELKGAIARRADETLAALREHDPEAAAAFPHVLRKLVTASAGSDAVTTRPARLSEFAEDGPEYRMVQAFLAPEARLLVASATDAGAEVRLAHEALLENWPAAREQIKADRRDLETRSRLEALHRRWREATGRSDKQHALLTGLNLAESSDLARRWAMNRTEGLGQYVALSESADQWRRRRVMVGAAVVVAIFAGIAALAGLQWRNAESARARAVASEQQTAQALRATKREVARSLSTQAELAVGRHDLRDALKLAIRAGEAERDVLGPNDLPASEPALLRALADSRQEMHIQRPRWGLSMPYGFYDDDTLVYADSTAGLVLTDLHSRARVGEAALPEKFNPILLHALPTRGLVAVAGGNQLVLADPKAHGIRAAFKFDSRVAAIDADDLAQRIAVATGTNVILIDLSTMQASDPITVPQAHSGAAVGQVRFKKGGSTLLVSYGAAVFRLNVATRQFDEAPFTQLTGAGLGLEKAFLENVLARGIVVIDELVPDLVHDGDVYVRNLYRLAVLNSAGAARVFDKESSDQQYLGMSFTDTGRTGKPSEAVTVLGRATDAEQEFQIGYVTDQPRPLIFDRFSVASSDLFGERPSSCQVSPNGSHLACIYSGKKLEGLMVWRLLGGKHRFEQVATRMRASSGVVTSAREPDMLFTADDAIVARLGGRESKVASLPTGWMLTGIHGSSVLGRSGTAGQVQIWRWDAGAATLTPVLGPVAGAAILADPAGERAAIVRADAVALHELGSGKPLAAINDLKEIRAVRFAPDGRTIVVATGTEVAVFDTASGRKERAVPTSIPADRPAAIDPAAERVAFLDAGGIPQVLTIASGETKKVSFTGAPAACLVWGPNVLLIGQRDGGILAWTPTGFRWTMSSPLGPSAKESNAWPGQPPKGFVLDIAISNDGRRFAIVRQDLPNLDIHDLKSGQYLTSLTTPWSYGVPAQVAFEADDLVVTAWSVHAMARAKPSYVSVHKLPRNFAETLAAARVRLAVTDEIRSPVGKTAAGRSPD